MKYFAVFAYLWVVVIGAYMLLFSSSGKIIKICFACNSMLTNIIAIITIAIGLAGLANDLRTKTANR
jgi:uncharacterized membrane protein